MKKKILNFFITLGVIMLIFLLTAVMSFAIYVAAVMDKEIDESVFDIAKGGSVSKIYCYGSGEEKVEENAVELVGQELYGGYRSKPVKYSEIPEDLVYSFVSIEDKRFFSHSGVDWKRSIAAGFNYFLRFNGNFGGSTITQQLIKNVTEEDDYTFQRKIQEMILALDLETKMSKSEILECYLNVINLSNGCYGVGAASEYYFSKDVGELTLTECTAIAAITNNPSYYDPIKHPENNQKRRRLILHEMYDQGYITEEEYNSSYGEELVITNSKPSSDNINLWYVDMVIGDVIVDLMEQRGCNRATASRLVYTGGLNIYTAMDKDIQLILERYYADTSKFYPDKSGESPQSAMIIIDPYSGDILAVAGAVGKKTANRVQNYAVDTVRPAGSVIKPLSVYAPAFEKGIINWASVYDDTPVNFGNYNFDPSLGRIVEPTAWPKNSTGVYRGLTNINYAVEHSVNTVSVKVLEDLGLSASFDFAKNKLHLDSIITSRTLSNGSTVSDRDYAALALGQFNYGVSLREITAAYSIFPDKGIYNDYRSYYKVTDRQGNIVLEKPYKGEAVISEGNSAVMTEILKNVLREGTASGIELKNSIDCAGKTGTTQNNCDRWFVGFTPYFIGGVWYGYEYPKPTDASAKSVCTEVWDGVMTLLHQKYTDGKIPKKFYRPENVVEAEYCRDSGKLICEACKRDPRGDRAEVGYFVKGTEPTEECDCHILVEYDTVAGGIASDLCAEFDKELVGLLNIKRSFPTQVYISDAQYVWQDMGSGVLPETSPELPFFNNLYGAGEYPGISSAEEQYNRYCRGHFDYYAWRQRNPS